VKVLRGFERPATSEHLIEHAGSLEQRAPGGKICAHPEHTKAVRAVQSFWLIDAQERCQCFPAALRISRKHLTVHQFAVALLLKGRYDLLNPVRRHKAIVVSESNNRTSRARDGQVVRARQSGFAHSLITDSPVTLADPAR